MGSVAHGLLCMFPVCSACMKYERWPCPTGEYSSDGYTTSTPNENCDANCDDGFLIKTGSCDASCNQCPGETRAAGCSYCKPGRYNPSRGQRSCLLCAAGRYSAKSGMHYNGCKECPAGRVSVAGSASATQCTNCPAGKYAEKGQSHCSDCDVGQYQQYTGRTSCIACVVGKYQNSTGSLACHSCPGGRYGTAAGHHLPDQCSQCSAVSVHNKSVGPLW